jgi:hypothetical protein
MLFLIVLFIFIKSNTTEHFYPYESYNLPKTIYLYWHDKNNSSVLENIKCWKRNIPQDWKIEFINSNNIKQYVSNEFYEKYKHLDATRFSDFLRLELLYNNGGVWMDAFILVTNGKFLDEYRNEMINSNYNATLYNFATRNIGNDIYLENWWIMAPQYSIFIHDLKYEFNRSYEMGFLNYKKNILIPSGINLTNTLGYGDATYLMQHAIINYLFYIGKNYNLNIKNATDNMFKIHDMFNWNHKQVATYLKSNNNWKKTVYAIKLVKTTRNMFKNQKDFLSIIQKI